MYWGLKLVEGSRTSTYTCELQHIEYVCNPWHDHQWNYEKNIWHCHSLINECNIKSLTLIVLN